MPQELMVTVMLVARCISLYVVRRNAIFFAATQALRLEEEETMRLREAVWQEGVVKRQWETLIEARVTRKRAAIYICVCHTHVYRDKGGGGSSKERF